MMMKTLCVVCLCFFVLQGCLIFRLEKSKKQLCQEPKLICPIITDTISIEFLKPTLFSKDIVTILGSRPLDNKKSGDYLFYCYSFANIKETSQLFNIPIALEFIQEKNKYLLTKAIVKKNIQTLLPKQLIQQLFEAVCTAERHADEVIVSLKEIDQSLLPKRNEILALLGKPASDNGEIITFLYCINGTNHTASISVHFDSQKGKMKKIDLIFFRYHLEVNWKENKAIGSFNSWQTSIGLGLKTVFSF